MAIKQDALVKLTKELSSVLQKPVTQSIKNRIAYIVSHGASYASNGYAVRTQGVAKALNDHGYETLCMVRPGRPWELDKDTTIGAEEIVDGVKYIHSGNNKDFISAKAEAHLKKSAEYFKELFYVYRPEYVIAASDFKIGLPALIAAKQLGIPFFNEVRGFWEMSRIAREPEYEGTNSYKRQIERDTFVAQQANAVFTLSETMRSELASRGIDKQQVHLLPNGVSKLPELTGVNTALRDNLGIQPDEKVIGFIGSINAYEGLDTLIAACQQLIDKGNKIKLLLVGDSQPLNSVLGDKYSNSINSNLPWLIQVGRVPHEKVGDYYSVVDTIAIPRKRLRVCDKVPPMKAAEALAHGKQLVVSDVEAMKIYSKEYESVVSFESDNVKSLERALSTEIKPKSNQKKKGLLFSNIVKPISLNLKNARIYKSSSTINRKKTKQMDSKLVSSSSLRYEGLKRKVIKIIVEADKFSISELKKAKSTFESLKKSVVSIVLVVKNNSSKEGVFELWKSLEGVYVDKDNHIEKEWADLFLIPDKEKELHKSAANINFTDFPGFCSVIKSLATSSTHQAIYFAYTNIENINNGYYKRTNYLYESFKALGYSVPVISFQSTYFCYKNNIAFIPDDNKILELILWWLSPIKVIAASNHENANRIIKFKAKFRFEFIYEMRGAWHETYAAKMREIDPNNEIENGKFYLENKDKELGIVSKSDKVIFISPELREYIEDKLPKRQLISHIAGNGVSVKSESQVPRFKLEKSPFVIGYFGAITYYEGINFLLEAVSELRNEGHQDIEVLLIGNNSIKHRSVLDIEKYTFAKHENFKSDISKEYGRVNLFVIPRKPYKVCNIVEPLKPFEYFSSKLPLLMSDCETLSRISDNEKNCLLFVSGDKADFKEKIIKVKEKGYPLDKLDNAISYVKKNRKWEDIAKGYAEFLGFSNRRTVYFMYADKWWISSKWSGATVNLINEMIMMSINFDVYYNDIFVNDLIDNDGVFDEDSFRERCSKALRDKSRRISRYLPKVMLPSKDYAAIFYRSGDKRDCVNFFLKELPHPKIYSHNYVKDIWNNSFVGFQNETAQKFAKDNLLSLYGDDGTLAYKNIDTTPKKNFIRYQAGVTQRPCIEDIVNDEFRATLKRNLDSKFLIGVIGTIYEGTYPESLIKVVKNLRREFPEKNIQLVFYTINILTPLPDENWIHITSFDKKNQAYSLLQLDIIVNTWKANAQLFSGSNKNLDAINFGIPLITAKTPSYTEQLGEHYPLFHDFENTTGRLSNSTEEKVFNLIKSCFDIDFVEQIRGYLLFRREFLSKNVVAQLYADQINTLHSKSVLITAQNFNVGGVQKYSMQMLKALSHCSVTIAVEEKIKEEKLQELRHLCNNVEVVSIEHILSESKDYDVAFLNSFPVDKKLLGRLTESLARGGCAIYPIVHTDIHRFTKNISYNLDIYSGIITVADIIISKLEKNTGMSVRPKSHLITPVLDKGVVPEFYQPVKTKRSYKVGYFGRMVGIKGIEFLVRSFLKFSREINCNYELHLYGPVGQPYLEKYLEDITNAEGKGIVYLHNHEILPSERIKILGELDALIYTTAMDGLPYTFLEAMELGTPVLSTSVGGINHLIDDEYNGMLFNFSNLYVENMYEKEPYGKLLSILKNNEEIYYKEFKRVLLKFVSDDELFYKMSKCAIKKVNEDFSICEMINRVRSIIY